MLRRRKQTRKRKKVDQAKPESKDRVSASEKAYLDRLEKMIGSPGQTPYIQRKGPKKPRDETPASEPVYDSGPQPADKAAQQTEQVAPPSEAPPQKAPRQPSTPPDQGRVRMGQDGVFELELDIPSADLEQFDDVKPKPPPRPAPTPPRGEKKPRQPKAPPEPKPRPEPEPEASKDLFPAGTLVVWNNNELAIYKEHREEKGYDVVYVAESGGRLVPKGVCLFAYEPRRVGQLSDAIFQWMERNMRWDREALVTHFDDPAVAQQIPVLQGESPAAEPTAATPERSNEDQDSPWVRGRTFTIQMGPHQWHGVYWARDPMGTVVAHNTNRVWTLMHLDLSRFGDDLQLGDVLPNETVEEIEKAVNGTDQRVQTNTHS